jgi:uncharacterized protein YbaA (DUF1428 family)
MFRAIRFALAALAAMAAPALAQTSGGLPAQVVDPLANDAAALKPAGDTASQVAFAYADRNSDVVVSWEEYRNRAMLLFGNVDTNSDGVMEIAELAALGGPNAPKAPSDIDLATYNAAVRKAFDDADASKDGALTPAEWANVIRPSKLF